MKQNHWFRDRLLKWNREENRREMPWKNEKDPYKIWLSEIILQQTRVEQGKKYYQKFLDHFPTVADLAAASEDRVLSLWEGLGYYSRARNLHFTAQMIASERQGEFPDTYRGLLELKGVGPYTAAAISAFAYGIPQPVIDGNSLRLVSRFLGSRSPIDTAEGKKKVHNFLDRAIPAEAPAAFNQALMDLGATVCKPAQPSCSSCPIREECTAFEKGIQSSLPVKAKKIKRSTRYFHFFYIQKEGKLALQKRSAKDIWKGLYQLPLIETETARSPSADQLSEQLQIRATPPLPVIYQARQQLTHRSIAGKFYRLEINNSPSLPDHWSFVEPKNLSKFAFPGIIRQFLDAMEGTLLI